MTDPIMTEILSAWSLNNKSNQMNGENFIDGRVRGKGPLSQSMWGPGWHQFNKNDPASALGSENPSSFPNHVIRWQHVDHGGIGRRGRLLAMQRAPLGFLGLILMPSSTWPGSGSAFDAVGRLLSSIWPDSGSSIAIGGRLPASHVLLIDDWRTLLAYEADLGEHCAAVVAHDPADWTIRNETSRTNVTYLISSKTKTWSIWHCK